MSNLIGVAGLNASGKSTVCAFVQKSGYKILSLSDIIRDELKVKNLPETRENLLNTGNLLRNEFGADVLAKRTLAKLSPNEKYCIDSIRHPAEVAALREKGLVLVGVVCDSKTRFDRLKSRGRVGDVEDLEGFMRIEKLELQNPDPKGQQLGLVLKECDITIQNDGTVDDLVNNVETQLGPKLIK